MGGRLRLPATELPPSECAPTVGREFRLRIPALARRTASWLATPTAARSVELLFTTLFATFWESHDPTQGMRQCNDVGTQYRSGIYFTTPEQERLGWQTLQRYQQALEKKLGHTASEITTEIIPVSEFYFAEDYHQQYLAKNPNGYCGLGGMGVCLPANDNII